VDAAHERQLDELYRASRAHDEATADRADRFLNITPETGEFLRALAVAMNARLLLELGTSNGYSTLWLAHACAITGGQVVTVERHDWKRELAATHLARAGLAALVEHRGGEIRDLLAGFPVADLVFLDSDREEYVDWSPQLGGCVRPGGLIVVDNVTSHAAEIAPLQAAVAKAAGFRAVLVPLGNGELIISRDR
jgi:predicted O-methyltransferase YrrM